ncbi:MAG: hypothetical protein QOH34_3119, partial [Mycobacterium sp.]|nr:hypothetical protein [Mycobacterium sp.]
PLAGWTLYRAAVPESGPNVAADGRVTHAHGLPQTGEARR